MFQHNPEASRDHSDIAPICLHLRLLVEPRCDSKNFNIDKVLHFCLVNFFEIEIDEVTSHANLLSTLWRKNLGHVRLHSVTIELGRVNEIILFAITEIDKSNVFEGLKTNTELFPLDDILESAGQLCFTFDQRELGFLILRLTWNFYLKRFDNLYIRLSYTCQNKFK